MDGKCAKSKLDKDTLTMRIYLRILEKSCATNQAFDSLFLEEDEDDDQNDNFAAIASQLERDVRAILLNPKDNKIAAKREGKLRRKEEKVKQKYVKEKRKIEEKKQKAELKLEKEKRKTEEKKEKAERKEQRQRQKVERKEEEKRQIAERRERKKQKRHNKNQQETIPSVVTVQAEETAIPSSKQRYSVLRILAGTRRKFRQM